MVLWVANRKVYGAHKLWKAARRAGHDIGRDQVARLMRELEIEGVSAAPQGVHHHRRSRRAAGTGPREPQLHRRAARTRLWVTDLTYVPTRSGMAYVCFIVDAFSRRIVGWRVAANMRTDMVLDALEMARRSRGSRRLVGLVAHSDAGSQFTSRAVHRTARRDRRPTLDRHRRRLLRQRARRDDQRALQDRVRLRARRATAWDDVDELELATLSWVHWFNEHRLHSHCDDVPPAEFEAAFYAAQQADPDRGWKPIARASIRPRAVH